MIRTLLLCAGGQYTRGNEELVQQWRQQPDGILWLDIQDEVTPEVRALLLVFGWLWAMAAMPVWAYLLAVYLGTALLKIRTYLEHRAHEAARARTVIIESRGPFSLLFLNNNFHVVHHMHPAVPWYKLPGMYAARRDHYRRRNEAYVYRNYAEIFRRYLFSPKDPVPHPIWPVYNGKAASDDAAELRGGAGIVEERHAGLITARH